MYYLPKSPLLQVALFLEEQDYIYKEKHTDHSFSGSAAAHSSYCLTMAISQSKTSTAFTLPT